MEKTSCRVIRHLLCAKHLHMRGENLLTSYPVQAPSETSPHAWRKLTFRTDLHDKVGNISTCVEKTNLTNCNKVYLEKHLHMRGENAESVPIYWNTRETSPHAWRKLPVEFTPIDTTGNISTCVEKTQNQSQRPEKGEKHLHMRGENVQEGIRRTLKVETSPHAWRKPRHSRAIRS